MHTFIQYVPRIMHTFAQYIPWIMHTFIQHVPRIMHTFTQYVPRIMHTVHPKNHAHIHTVHPKNYAHIRIVHPNNYAYIHTLLSFWYQPISHLNILQGWLLYWHWGNHMITAVPTQLDGYEKIFSMDPQLLYIDGLVQDCSNSSALAMEFLQSCAKPLLW